MVREIREQEEMGDDERTSPWKPIEERLRERAIKRVMKREAVLRTAAHLFVEQGYHHATLDEVARRLHITKPALFHYFSSKEDILLECYRSGQERLTGQVQAVTQSSGTGLEKVIAFMRFYAEFMTTDFGKLIARVSDQELSAVSRDEVRQAKRAIDRQLRDLLSEGMADGSIQSGDPKLAAFAIAGALNWIGYWHQPEGALDANIISEYFARLLTSGIAAPAKFDGL